MYNYAESSSLHDGSIPGPDQRGELTRSIASVYKRIALTSLVDPYHLSYGEIWRVYEAFEDCADSALIGPAEERPKAAGIFVIDPMDDHRPSPYADPKTALSNRCRILDANPVIAALNTRQVPTRRGGRDSLITVMTRALSLPPKRHTPRETSEGRVSLIMGVSAVHHFLGGETVQYASSGEGGELSHREPASPEAPDVDGIVSVGPSYNAEFWEVLNEGPSGIGVIKRLRPNNAIGVGELIGIQFPLRGESGTRWRIGVVRWLSIEGSGEYQVGVQIFGRSAEAVEVSVDGGASSVNVAAAVAVPALVADGRPSMIAPVGVISPDLIVTAHTSRTQVQLKPESLIERTANFERFSYSVLG